MKRSFEIKSDCLDIIKRIKSIDKHYFVLFNLDTQKFELHNHSQSRSTYCLTFPFEQLDERAYLHVLKTRVQNSDEIFKRMGEHNQKLFETTQKQVLNDFKEKLYDS